MTARPRRKWVAVANLWRLYSHFHLAQSVPGFHTRTPEKGLPIISLVVAKVAVLSFQSIAFLLGRRDRSVPRVKPTCRKSLAPRRGSYPKQQRSARTIRLT